MRVYADTSFIVKLLSRESGSEDAVAEYRRWGRPALAFLPLHALEVENAIRARAFQQRNSVPSRERSRVGHEEGVALRRIEHFLARGVLLAADAEWDAGCARAMALSRKHTARTGARTLDLLHRAFALEAECELFLSTDQRQCKIAASEGLKVVLVTD